MIRVQFIIMESVQLVKSNKWIETIWHSWYRRFSSQRKLIIFISVVGVVVGRFTWQKLKSRAQPNNQGGQENQEEQNQQNQQDQDDQAANNNFQGGYDDQEQNLSTDNQGIQFQQQQQQEFQQQGGNADNEREEDNKSDNQQVQYQINDDGQGQDINQSVDAELKEKSKALERQDLLENEQQQELNSTSKAGGSAFEKSTDVDLSKVQENSQVLLEEKGKESRYALAIEAPNQFEQSIIQKIQEVKGEFNQKSEVVREHDQSVVQAEQPLKQEFNQSLQFEVIDQKSPQKNDDFQVEVNEKRNQVANGQDENLRVLEKQDEEEEEDEGLLQLIHRLYELSCNSRQVPEEYQRFVGVESDVEALVQEYAPQNGKLANELRNCLNGFRRIRGDGNCFYTAFIYQYLQWLLSQGSEETFDQRIKELQHLKSFKICYPEKNFNIEEDSQTKKLAQIFARKLINLRRKPDLLLSQLADTSNPLYGLSIIYIRNLVAQIIEADENRLIFFGLDVDEPENKLKELFEWEKECNSTEIVIVALAEHLKLAVNTFHVETENSTVLLNTYNAEDQQNGQINLLFQPGHYQVGIARV